MADVTRLINVARLVREWALTVQGTSLARNELASFLFRHVFGVVIVVTGIGIGVGVGVDVDVGVGVSTGSSGGGGVGGGVLGHVCQDIYVEEKAVSPCSM